jgi:hypothetical protein
MSTGASPTFSNFPGGFANGLSVRGMPLMQMQPGQVFYLGNGPALIQGARGGSDGNRGTFLSPYATLQGALNSASSGSGNLSSNQGIQDGRGDIIFILPGHRETITSATALSLNQAGVAIIGLGAGLLRPTFVLSTATTATINVLAAGMSIQNCLFLANFAGIASVFTAANASFTAVIAGNLMTTSSVTGTINSGATIAGTGILPGIMVLNQVSGTVGGAGVYTLSQSLTFASGSVTSMTPDFAIDNCEFRDISTVLNFVTIFSGASTTNACDGFQFTRNRVYSLGNTTGTTCIKPLARADRMQLNSNFVDMGILNDTPILLTGGVYNHQDLEIGWNILNRPNTSATGGLMMSSSATSCTGHVHDNYVWSLVSTPLLAPTGTKLAFDQNYVNNTGAADKSGLLLPANT